jgi:hypothetical protein
MADRKMGHAVPGAGGAGLRRGGTNRS